jgi:hypothetical protein
MSARTYLHRCPAEVPTLCPPSSGTEDTSPKCRTAESSSVTNYFFFDIIHSHNPSVRSAYLSVGHQSALSLVTATDQVKPTVK